MADPEDEIATQATERVSTDQAESPRINRSYEPERYLVPPPLEDASAFQDSDHYSGYYSAQDWRRLLDLEIYKRDSQRYLRSDDVGDVWMLEQKAAQDSDFIISFLTGELWLVDPSARMPSWSS